MCIDKLRCQIQTAGRRITGVDVMPQQMRELRLTTAQHAALGWLADEGHSALQHYQFDDADAAGRAAENCRELGDLLPFYGERDRWNELAENFESQHKSLSE
jgi:hypothetical protein